MNSESLKRWGLKAIGAIGMLIFIEVIGIPLKTTIRELVEILWNLSTEQGLMNDLWITTRRFMLGYFLALMTAVPFGIIVGRIKSLNAIFNLPIELLRPIPSAVVIPLGIAFLGIGDYMKVFVIWFGAFWPMLVVTRDTCSKLDPTLLETAEVFHLSRTRTMLTIVLPATIPPIMATARAAMAIALLLAVTVEMISGGDPSGLGFFIVDSQRSFQQGKMLAGVMILAVFGYLLNMGFRTIESTIYQKRFNYLK
jgi:ABC-type nitrate/sulfonate/bicarbonate transport system permease component